MSTRARAWLIGALAALVSFAGSWVPSYWSDEVATVQAASLSPHALLHFTTTRTDAVHGVYYLVMHYWTAVFGTSEAATRSLSALGIGVAAALAVLIGALLDRPRLGVVAAIIFALMPRVTESGEEARSYAWTAALAAALWLLLLIALRRRRWWWWAALGVVAMLSVALFLLSATLAVAQLVFVALRRRRALVPLVLAWAAAALIAVPIEYVAWHERAQVAWLGSAVPNPWSALVEPWAETSWGFGIAASALLIVGALRWRAALARACGEYLLLAGCWVVVPLVLLLATTATASPLFTPRYLTFSTPGFALLLAAAAASLATRRLAVIAVVVVIAAALPTYVAQRGPYGKNGGSDLRQLADIVHTHARPGDAVVFEPSPVTRSLNPRRALAAYPQKFAGLADVALKTPFPDSGSFYDKVVPLRLRQAKLRGIDTVWLVQPGIGTSCNAGDDARTLRGLGFESDARYPANRNVVCEFSRG